MAIHYKIKAESVIIPEDTTLLSFGSLFIQKESEKYNNGLEYIHRQCVGAFIKENNGDIILYCTQDFGKKVCFTFLVKDSNTFYYLSGYNKGKVIGDILIAEKVKKGGLIAEKVKGE